MKYSHTSDSDKSLKEENYVDAVKGVANGVTYGDEQHCFKYILLRLFHDVISFLRSHIMFRFHISF